MSKHHNQGGHGDRRHSRQRLNRHIQSATTATHLEPLPFAGSRWRRESREWSESRRPIWIEAHLIGEAFLVEDLTAIRLLGLARLVSLDDQSWNSQSIYGHISGHFRDLKGDGGK